MREEQLRDAINRLSIFPLSRKTTSQLHKPKETRYPGAKSQEPTAPLSSWGRLQTYMEREGRQREFNCKLVSVSLVDSAERNKCVLVAILWVGNHNQNVDIRSSTVSECSQPSPSDFSHARCFQGTKFDS